MELIIGGIILFIVAVSSTYMYDYLKEVNNKRKVEQEQFKEANNEVNRQKRQQPSIQEALTELEEIIKKIEQQQVRNKPGIKK